MKSFKFLTVAVSRCRRVKASFTLSEDAVWMIPESFRQLFSSSISTYILSHHKQVSLNPPTVPNQAAALSERSDVLYCRSAAGIQTHWNQTQLDSPRTRTAYQSDKDTEKLNNIRISNSIKSTKEGISDSDEGRQYHREIHVHVKNNRQGRSLNANFNYEYSRRLPSADRMAADQKTSPSRAGMNINPPTLCPYLIWKLINSVRQSNKPGKGRASWYTPPHASVLQTIFLP